MLTGSATFNQLKKTIKYEMSGLIKKECLDQYTCVSQ